MNEEDPNERKCPCNITPFRPRVVLAEDDLDTRCMLRDALALDGYEVVVAGDGLALFEELQRAHASGYVPALVLSDIRMPGLTGLEVLHRVREWGWTIPVILITGFGDEDGLRAARALGASAVFHKPFGAQDLRTAVACFLPRRRENDRRV